MRWYAKKAGNDHQGLVIDEATGRTVAVAYDRADMELLAAAPELLAALRRLRDCPALCLEGLEPEDIAAVRAASDAIAATGKAGVA